MGNYKVRREGLLKGWQINAAEMMFQGFKDGAICEALWNVDPEDKNKMRTAKERLKRLRRSENFQAYYKSIITEWTVHNVGKAMNKLAEQIDSKQPWLANKAANDVLIQCKPFIATEDDKTVVVRFDGMPEIGSPDE